ncbi:SLATT domain-containing protein [Pricia sp. S334]|uniref:SLATT domain-containing protein n=1 Tax=Pricia mediterranea TaxID=3076079 RepID=A0ABU3L3J9_9FLAO|nr:SLATT domain-containing protein [Pricia sp. S334]MDT7827667.1 SLATT domain-containing protein [Pricia sp. S334]
MNEKLRRMLLDWMRKIHQLEYAHCYQSIFWANFEKWIGIGAFVISTIVAFSYRFPQIDIPWIQDILLPFILLIVAILTGLQTFLKPSEKAENHKRIGFNYEKLRHSIELILNTQMTDEKLNREIEIIKNEWADLKSVYVSNRKFIKGKQTVKKLKKYPEELSFLDTIDP